MMFWCVRAWIWGVFFDPRKREDDLNGVLVNLKMI